MSNHFPTIPTLNLYGIVYTANIASVEHLTYFDVTGVQPLEDTLGPQIGGVDGIPFEVPFYFTTPGDPGSFDQDTAEGQITTVLNDLAQAVATATGQTLADVQASITVQRQWIWQDSSGQFTLQYNGDTMTYPV